VLTSLFRVKRFFFGRSVSPVVELPCGFPAGRFE